MNRLTSVSFLFMFTISYGQVEHKLNSESKNLTTPPALTNIGRYGVDYIFKDCDFQGDSTILNAIDLDSAEQYRPSSGKAEIIDQATGVTLVLFAEKRRENSSELNIDD